MKNIVWVVLLIASAICGCTKSSTESHSFTKDKVTGYVQKGPYLNGSSITVYELDEVYAQTGKSFNVQVLDNAGSFQIRNLNVATKFVKIKADGFYYNEVLNKNSAAPLTLYTISDLSISSTLNINLITSLEVARTEFLLGTGLSFAQAKQQTRQELLRIFSITRPQMADAEKLDITQSGDDHAILLAISVILQGYRAEADLSQLLADISTDIRTDGILNSPSLGSLLINDVALLDLAPVRQNLTKKYQDLGLNVTIPEFEKYVKMFLDSTSFVFTNYPKYPLIVNSLENALTDSSLVYTSGKLYSLGAYLPYGTATRVVVKTTPGTLPAQLNMVMWGSVSAGGWTLQNYYSDSLIFYARGTNNTVSAKISFGPPPISTDFIFYENISTTPSRIKTIVNL